MATATSDAQKMSETAQQMAWSAQRTGKILSGYITEAQEINTQFARRATETWIEAFRKQTELNQRIIQRLYGEAEGQTGAWQGLVRDWMGMYSVPFNPACFADPFAFFPFFR